MRNDSPVKIGVLKADEDPEDELDKSGTIIGTKFSVLQIIRIPSLMRCGFLTIDPFVGIPVLIAATILLTLYRGLQ